MIKIEKTGEHKGLKYSIVFMKFGHRCGYVASDKVVNFDDLEVHGGITYDEYKEDSWRGLPAKSHVIGFDCNHYWDNIDLKKSLEYKLITESEYEIHSQFNNLVEEGAIVKTLEYVENECIQLINQIIGGQNE